MLTTMCAFGVLRERERERETERERERESKIKFDKNFLSK